MIGETIRIMTLETILTLISLAGIPIGAVVWFVRLEGRVKQHDLLFVERQANDKERYETLLREISSLRTLIERRVNSRPGSDSLR